MRHSFLLALVLCLLALPAAATITVDSGGITATITPGHTAVLIYCGVISNVFTRGGAAVADSDGDGIVHLTVSNFPLHPTVLSFDVQQGTYEVLPGFGTADITSSEVEPVVEHGPGGAMSYISFANPGIAGYPFAAMALIRPGSGAWLNSAAGGASADDDGVQNYPNYRTTRALSSLQPVPGSPAVPSAVQNGDYVFFVAPGEGYVIEKVVLPAPSSPGRFVPFADPATKVEGKAIHISISRELGSDGTVSCSYSTKPVAGDSARFQAVSGTLTFAPGETVKSFDIPTVNDNTYSGPASIEVDLTGSGAPADTPSVTVSFADDEPPPSLSVADVSIVDDGSNGGTVPMTVTLTGATTLTSSVDVYTDNDNYVDFAPGETSKTFNVPWTRSRVAGGLPAVQLFSPQNCTIARGQAYITFVSNGPLPQIRFAYANVPEGNSTTNFDIPVTLSAPSTQTVTVDYATSDGLAKAGVDYIAVSGTLHFAPGETSKVVSVPIIGNNIQQHDRGFALTLSNPVGATLPATTMGYLIVDDDVSTISTADVSVTEGNSGTTTATVTVVLSCPSADAVTMGYRTSDFTAFAGEDYVTTSGVLRFDPGVVQQTISIPIIPNTTPQPNRAFRLVLMNPTGATPGQMGATITIVDDDPGPSAYLTPNDLNVLEGGPGTANAAVDVALSQALPQTVTVNYATSDASARAGVDYTAVSGTLTIPAGETHRSVLVPILGNNVQQQNRAFAISFSHIAGATFTKQTAIVTIVDDDVSVLTIPDAVVSQTSSVTHATLAVTLSCPAAYTSNVSYTTVDGSAVAGHDYVAASGQLTFAPGETQKTIPIDILGDANTHPPRTFTVVLSNASTVAIGRGTATVTIVNGVLPHHRAAAH